MYKGIIKVIYDRGFALQSKAVLVESVTTVAQVIQHATEAFNLLGAPDDYALEERDILGGSEYYYYNNNNIITATIQRADYCPWQKSHYKEN